MPRDTTADTQTVLRSKSLEFLEAEIVRVRDELHLLELSLRVLEPITLPSTLPQSRVIVRDNAEMKHMTEADLLQEIAHVKSGILRLGHCLGDLAPKRKHAIEADISKAARELGRVSKRDMDPEDTDHGLYCLCRLPYNGTRMMIQCDTCEEWFHITCVGILYESVSETEEYICPICTSKAPTEAKQKPEPGQVWPSGEGDFDEGYTHIDPVLCRKGAPWLEVEIEATSREISIIAKEMQRMKRALHRAQAKAKAKAEADAAAAKAAKAKAARARAKAVRIAAAATKEAKEASKPTPPKRGRKRKSLDKAHEGAAVALPQAKEAAKPETDSEALLKGLSGEALSVEIHRIMTEYGLTQAIISSEAHLQGGASAMSTLLRGHEVPNRDVKEAALRDWLKRTYASIEAGDMHKRERPRSRRSSITKFSVGDSIDVCSKDGSSWSSADITTVGKTRVKIHVHGAAKGVDSWVGIKSGRLAPAGSHSSTSEADAATGDSSGKRDPAEESAFVSTPKPANKQETAVVMVSEPEKEPELLESVPDKPNVSEQEAAAIMSLHQMKQEKLAPTSAAKASTKRTPASAKSKAKAKTKPKSKSKPAALSGSSPPRRVSRRLAVQLEEQERKMAEADAETETDQDTTTTQ